MDITAEKTSPSKAPLSERSANTHLPTNSVSQVSRGKTDGEAELKAATTKSMEYHRQVLQEKLEEGKTKEPGHYISPSDGIMSPCTKKLSDLKGKKFKNAGKPQVLFSKALAKKSFDKMNSDNKEVSSGADDSPGTDAGENRES